MNNPVFQKYLREMMLCKNQHYIIGFHRGQLFVRDTDSKRIIQKIRIHPISKSFKLIERLFRFRPRSALFLDDTTILFSDHGYIKRYSIQDKTIHTEHAFDHGMNNPLSFCIRRDKEGTITDILYGEYFGNGSRLPVSIYRRTGSQWDKVYTFPAKSIQHIHNIVYDQYRNRYLILTGDQNEESGIWEADLEFKEVKPVIKGSQKYRACVLYPTETGFYYATDTPLEQNYIYYVDNDLNITEIAKTPGPCIFGIVKNDHLYFATSVEGDPTLGGWKYRLSNKLGKGVKDRYSHLFRISHDGKFEELGKMKKDFLPMWLFEFGNMQFPQSDDTTVYICPQSVVARYNTYYI